MRTIDYSWYLPPFPEYNEAQSAAVPFLDKDMNLVISFATAAGKTVLAECYFGYHLTVKPECRVGYVCPFKSLASEKRQEWEGESQLAKYGLALWTSDSGEDDNPATARLVVDTLESFDSKTRSERWESWIRSMDCVAFDEAHVIGGSRGGAMEAAMMRLVEANPEVRLVLLSATMGNALEIAKWVKSLNGKPTKCITSSWRPTRIDMKACGVSGYDERVEKAVELAGRSCSKKTLVFVHSKVTGAEIVRRLRKTGVRAAFHNASLSGAKRRRVEEAFNDPSSGLNIVVSTSTLGAGVNMGG